MEYIVAQSDSIERIAATHDCTVGELMKMNRLATRMVFPGQKLLVPYPLDGNDVCSVLSGSRLSANQATITAGNSSGDRIRRGPGMAVQVCGRAATRSDTSRTALEKHRVSLAEDETNTDCMKRFIKLKVKQMTEMNGTVTGTLLVTPSALMFDPDVIHPLVLENGQDLYIMMARMEEVISVTMFKSATVLTDTEGDKEFHDIAVQDPSAPECSTVLAAFREETVNKTSENSADDIHKNTDNQSPRIFFDDMDLELKRKEDKKIHIGHVGSDFKSLLIVKKENKIDEAARTARRTYSDLSNGRKGDEIDRIFISGNDKDKPEYCLQPSTSTNVAHTGLTCNPLSKLGRTLSFHANTIRGSVTSGAERMTQSAMSGTKSVAQGVVSQSKAVAGTLQTGIQTSVKVAASHAKTAVGVVTTVPQGIASMGSGLFSASQHPETFFEDKAVSKTRKEQNLATLLSLKEKAQKLREEAMKNKHFFCGTSTDEMLNLFKPVHELPSATQTFSAEKSILTDLPYYMIVRLNRKKKCDKERFSALDTVRSSSATTEDVIANQTRQEFWFAIPKHKVDAIYHFLLQWNPEKYGSSIKKSVDQQEVCEVFEDCGFVVLDSETSQKFASWLLFCSLKYLFLDFILKVFLNFRENFLHLSLLLVNIFNLFLFFCYITLLVIFFSKYHYLYND
uniref:LysM domain-containing protein n=1 Tax=Wuchereria bancrofti TaxID=6293 RepID=A0AAF5PTF3_WUCBA